MSKHPPKPDSISPQREAAFYYLTIQMARLVRQADGPEEFYRLTSSQGLTDARIIEMTDMLLAFEDRPLPPEGTPPALLKKAKAWLARYDKAETRARLKRADLTDPDIDALLEAIEDGRV